MLLAAAVGGGPAGLRESDNARRPGPPTPSGSAQALIDDRLDRSLLLAQAGRVLDDTAVTRSHLLSALVRPPGAVGVMQGGGDPLYALALSPDGRMLATGGETGPFALRPAVAPEDRPSDPDRRPIVSLDFSPDGNLLAANAGIGGGRES